MASRLAPFFTQASKAIKALDVQHGKPVVTITDGRKMVIPLAVTSLHFFTWGLTYGLLDVMNYHVRIAIGARRDETALLALGYYLAYLFGPAFIAGPVVKRAGYRACMTLGLLVVGLGCIAMSAGASSCGLPGMVGAHS